MPFLTDILSRVISVLPQIKTDIYRYAWAHALRAFCESVREYVSASAVTKIEYDDIDGDGEDCVEDKRVMSYRHFEIQRWEDLQHIFVVINKWFSLMSSHFDIIIHQFN